MPSRPAILSMPLPLHNPQRRRYTYLPRSLASLVLLALCLTFTLALAARPPAIPDTLVPPSLVPPTDRSSIEAELAELEAKGIVLLDTRPPPKPASDWDLASFSGELLRRGYAALLPREEDEESTTATPSKTSTHSSSHSSSATSNATPSATSSATSSTSSDDETVATAAPTATSAPLPVPFDSNIGADFASEACPQFISSFLATPEFQACYPVSLLLDSSQSFFKTLQSPFLTTDLLDHSCAAPTTCGTYLSTLAFTLNSTCTLDLSRENPTATMALKGLLAYPSLRTATCLKSSTGSYCFADAITNSTSDEDAYVYYMGVGHELPTTTEMTCNQCLKDVVGVFGAAAANRTLPIADVYAQGAAVVNSVCGAGWVNETLPAAFTGGAVGGRIGCVVGVVVALVVGVLLV